MGTLIEIVLRFLPGPETILVVAPLALICSIVVAALAGYLRIGLGLRTPYTRKIFHFLIFSVAGVVQIIWGLQAVVVYGTVVALAVLFIVWKGDGFAPYEALARETDAPHRRYFILVPLLTTAIGGGISNLLFPGFAAIGYLVVGWGDAVGEPVGTRWGRHRYKVPSRRGVAAERSIEGSAAVFVTGTVAAFFGLLAAGYAVHDAVPMAFGAGLAGAAFEAVSTHGFDNMTVQVAASGAAFLIARLS